MTRKERNNKKRLCPVSELEKQCCYFRIFYCVSTDSKCDLTNEGVLVELLQVRRGLRWSVDDLAIIDVGLSEILHRRVRSVPMLDCTCGRKQIDFKTFILRLSCA